jgi:hypothetical protein
MEKQSYRIDRFEASTNSWAIARVGYPTLTEATNEFDKMKSENPNSKLRMIKIESTLVLEK